MMARQAELAEEIGFKSRASESHNKGVIIFSAELFCQRNFSSHERECILLTGVDLLIYFKIVPNFLSISVYAYFLGFIKL